MMEKIAVRLTFLKALARGGNLQPSAVKQAVHTIRFNESQIATIDNLEMYRFLPHEVIEEYDLYTMSNGEEFVVKK